MSWRGRKRFRSRLSDEIKDHSLNGHGFSRAEPPVKETGFNTGKT